MARREQDVFRLTNHALQRMRERFPDEFREAVDFEQTEKARRQKTYEFLWNARVENRVINDTNFMRYVQERYGYENRMRFFVNGNMLFIGIIDNGQHNIVTVVNRERYSTSFLHQIEKKMQRKPDTFSRKQQIPSWQIKDSSFKRKKREYLENQYDDDT